MPDYAAALKSLAQRGLLYRCFRTRSEIARSIEAAPHGAMEAWRGSPLPAEEERRRMDAGEPYAWRLSLDAAGAALGGFDGLTFVAERSEGPRVGQGGVGRGKTGW